MERNASRRRGVFLLQRNQKGGFSWYIESVEAAYCWRWLSSVL